MAWNKKQKSSWRNCKGERRPDKNGRPMTKEEMIIRQQDIEHAEKTGDYSKIEL